ncbi:DNA methyltransferase, partial [uncultured Bacteroides sp.]|uniref:DNA methyltransferase n=1 Tax=uncultured Bacteroides sp. TaxID=162156 RepID=UPI00261CB4C7
DINMWKRRTEGSPQGILVDILTMLRVLSKTQVKKESSSNDPFTKPQNSIKVLTFPIGSINTKLPDGVYPKGTYGTIKFPNELLNDLVITNGVNSNEVSFSNKFIWIQETLNENLSKGLKVDLSKQLVLSYKKADYNPECPPNLIDIQVGVTTTEEAGKELEKLMHGNVFEYPKDVSLIKYLLKFKNQPDAVVLDFFSGSATTAHAVMQLNAEDNGNRKYIMVQLPEETPEDSEARKAGYHTIPQIAKERIRRAGKKIKEESPLTTQNLDTGFRVFRLADSNFEEVKKAPGEYNQAQLDLFLNNVKSDRTDLDLLFGAMLSWGVQLSLPMSSEEVDGKMIYTVNEGDLVACFAEDITENIVKAMAAKQPLRVLFRDSCFTRDDAKINVFETLKQLLDWSEEEAMKNIKVI